jgi:hypothetical protein
LVDLDRITAFRLAAEERGARMALEAAAKVADDRKGRASLARSLCRPEYKEVFEAEVDVAESIATAIRQIDPASLGAE